MQGISRNLSRISSTLRPLRDVEAPALDTDVQGLAGADLVTQWDAAQFASRGRMYSQEFMARMHHPFGEVLAALFLDADHKALRYNSYFRGDRPSALSQLPDIARSAQALAAVRLVLAYSMVFDPNATLPDVRRMHARMHEAGVELHDFLLISPGQATRSLLAPRLP